MASNTIEDWDLGYTSHQSTAAEYLENWDGDFEVMTRNNSPRKSEVSTPLWEVR